MWRRFESSRRKLWWCKLAHSAGGGASHDKGQNFAILVHVTKHMTVLPRTPLSGRCWTSISLCTDLTVTCSAVITPIMIPFLYISV